MLEVEKWAQGRPRFLSLIAISLVVGADGCLKLFEAIKEGAGDIAEETVPDLSEWLGLYRDHRSVWKAYLELSGVIDPSSLELYSWMGGVAKEDKIKTDFDEFIEKTDADLSSYWRAYLDEIEEDSKKVAPPVPVPEHELPPVFRSAAAGFAVRVWYPCYFIYGSTPTQLLWEAHHGNLVSLEKLARLDRSVIFDAKIQKNLHSLFFSNRVKHEEVMESLLKQPKGKVSKQKVKISFAGLISFFFDSFDHPLTEPEIRSLFDAWARDNGEGQIDVDLPESSESFYMAIYREVPFWRKTMMAYKS